MEAPVGVFGVTGIGDQRDFDAPYFQGYRISPRYQSDLSTAVNAAFSVTTPWNIFDGALDIENQSTGAGGYYWTFGDGGTSNEEVPEYTYTDAGVYDVSLTVFSEDGNCSDQITVEVDVIVVNVDELSSEMNMWPNPARDYVIFESSVQIERLQVFDLNGRPMLDKQLASNRAKLELSGWASGVYIAKIVTTEGIKIVKLQRED
jgi:hypothetical protein